MKSIVIVIAGIALSNSALALSPETQKFRDEFLSNAKEDCDSKARIISELRWQIIQEKSVRLKKPAYKEAKSLIYDLENKKCFLVKMINFSNAIAAIEYTDNAEVNTKIMKMKEKVKSDTANMKEQLRELMHTSDMLPE